MGIVTKAVKAAAKKRLAAAAKKKAAEAAARAKAAKARAAAKKEYNLSPKARPSVPLRNKADVLNCIDMLNEDTDIVVTITNTSRSPYFNMVKEHVDGTVGLVIPAPTAVTRRQDAPAVYDMTTVAYVVAPRFVMTHDSTFNGRVRAVHVPRERAIDIDTLIDFKMAEFYLSQIGNAS